MEATRSEERAARNEVLFREANEKLEGKRQAHTELIRLSLEQDEHVRSHASWFLIADGHDAQEARPGKHDGYAIVEKDGVARRIAEEENPRT